MRTYNPLSGCMYIVSHYTHRDLLIYSGSMMAANKIQYREIMEPYTKWRRMRLTACMKMQINGDGIEYVELSIPLRHSTMPTTQQSGLPRPSNAKSRRRKSCLEAFKKSKGRSRRGPLSLIQRRKWRTPMLHIPLFKQQGHQCNM